MGKIRCVGVASAGCCCDEVEDGSDILLCERGRGGVSSCCSAVERQSEEFLAHLEKVVVEYASAGNGRSEREMNLPKSAELGAPSCRRG